MTVAEAVKRLVEVHGSQAALAARLGTTQQTVSRWRAGEVPPAAEMAKLVFDLLAEAGETTTQTKPSATDATEGAA